MRFDVWKALALVLPLVLAVVAVVEFCQVALFRLWCPSSPLPVVVVMTKRTAVWRVMTCCSRQKT
jgi:hypothetical protein